VRLNQPAGLPKGVVAVTQSRVGHWSFAVLGVLALAGCAQPGLQPTAESREGAGHATTSDADTTDRVRSLLDEGLEDLTVGLYLREIGGGVHADFNESFKFEPASTIKALVHFHALRQVQTAVEGGADLAAELDGTLIQRDTAACPAGTEAESLRTALSQMMLPSSNFWTRALQDFYGDAAIDATRQALGMTDTQLERTLGCGGQPGGEDADPNQPFNQLTLIDAGVMYEAVATGFLDATVRAVGFPGQLMVTHAAEFNAVIADEAAGLGLSSAALDQFRSLRVSANKPGSVTLNDGLRYTSVAGWARLAFKDGACEIEPREYVYGAFRYGADPDYAFAVGMAGAATDLFREQVRAALASWAACEADLEVVGAIVVDAPDEIDVNTPTALTVRLSVRNNGPAPTIDAQLTTTSAGPDDCSITPEQESQSVLGLDAGDIRTVDVEVVVECSDPSFHLFAFDATIAPLDPLVTDPVPANDAAATSATIALIALADLAILGWDLAALDGAGLGDLVVGQSFLFDTLKTLHNFGDAVKGLHEAPVDATVTATLDIPAGLRGSIKDGNVTAWFDGPATITRDVAVAGLEVGADRVITETFGIHCLEPGQFLVQLANTIAANDEHVVDPDPSNDTIAVDRVIDCVTPVQINIRPGNPNNHVNPGSAQTLPVAILTTEAGEYGLPIDFDATTVVHATVRFGVVGTLDVGGGSTAWPDRGFIRDSFEMDDLTKDGDLDMVLLVAAPGSGIDADTVEACMVGTYLGEDAAPYTFFGCDVVGTLPPAG
jgi:hypothetical protein